MKNVFSILLLALCATMASAQVKVSFDELRANWDSYQGEQIRLTTPMVVTGVFYDSLLLSPERLYVPEEKAVGLHEGDSTTYYQWVKYNHEQSLCLSAKYYPYQILHGAVLRNLTAKVSGTRRLVTGQTPHFTHNRPKAVRPNTKAADLVICAANIQNYFADLGGYAGAKDEKKFKMQTEKVARALNFLHADIYAICEMERGNKSPQVLVDRMNQLAHKQLYAYVNNDGGDGDGDVISVCYLYRTDRVRPYGPTLYAYELTEGYERYHNRFKAKGFEDIRTGERFSISLNHPRSKRGDPRRSDSLRMENIYRIEAVLQQMEETYNDPDILMLGDYNCYTYERPIQYICAQGYIDEVMKHNPTGYSYVWKGEMGYLDRVFANTTMDKQILFVHPVHLNADCFYSLGYKSRYAKPTVFRYSDHEPLLIGIKYKND